MQIDHQQLTYKLKKLIDYHCSAKCECDSADYDYCAWCQTGQVLMNTLEDVDDMFSDLARWKLI